MAEEDVTKEPESSPAEAQQATDTGAVTPETAGSPRTIDNVYGEFNRKFGKLQQQVEAVLGYLANQNPQQPRQAPAVPTQGQQGVPTDQELYALAQQGDQAAYQEYHRRIAAREYDTKFQVERKTQFVQSQLNALVSRYPVLRDASHPLTQYAHQAYALMTQAGWPADASTLLEAAKTAIADKPELISEMFNQGNVARESGRQSATQRSQAGVTGASHRSLPAPTTQAAIKVSQAERDLAKRMNIKDPAKAKERFLKRQEDGTSKLGGVSAFIPEGDF